MPDWGKYIEQKRLEDKRTIEQANLVLTEVLPTIYLVLEGNHLNKKGEYLTALQVATKLNHTPKVAVVNKRVRTNVVYTNFEPKGEDEE